MKRLTPHDKEEIYQAYLNGNTFKEIADATGRSLATIKKAILEQEANVEEAQEQSSEDTGKSIEDFYDLIIQAKDAHIASLESIIKALTGAKQ